jgi:transglutaminase-like putative cysteine protease
MSASSATTTPSGRGFAARRTTLALIATALGAVPLHALLSDNTWLYEAWASMAITLAPAALLRLRRPASALDVWPGIVLLIPWLTWSFVPTHAFGRLIPTTATWGDVTTLMDDLHRTTHDEVAPVHSTVAIRLVTCALLGLLAALIDLLAVVGRHGALAGVPLLMIYTIAGAVPRHTVGWAWFCVAAVGYLILLGIDAGDGVRSWGRRISRPGGGRGRMAATFSAQRIGVVSIVFALFLPLLLPARSQNLLREAFHSFGGNSGGIAGFGAGDGAALSPFVALKGQLTRGTALPLFSVHIDAGTPVVPFYVRSNVLDTVTAAGWQLGSHGGLESTGNTSYDALPEGPQTLVSSYNAVITISGLADTPPVFAVPTAITGLSSDSNWSPQDQVLVGASTHSGEQYDESVSQPQPSPADLNSALDTYSTDVSMWLALPPEPSAVSALVNKIISGKDSPYGRARAISDWFANPANGFAYSVQTPAGDSGSDLVDFLTHRVGFCQQYAAAMGIMFRMAGVPTRVVLGYMHDSPDVNGSFTVTTQDAHAWDEAFFSGVGWIPFDPTPPAGLAGGKSSDLVWAPHTFPSSGTASAHVGPNKLGVHQSSSAAPVPNSASSGGSAGAGPAPWIGLGVLVALAIGATPGLLRMTRRRRRLLLARRGDPDPLWAELTDTTVDLGYVWSPARSPRQVVEWLSRDAGDAAAGLATLAHAVEVRRYAPVGAPGSAPDLGVELRAVTDRLRARRSRRIQVLSRLWPASLGLRVRIARHR